MSIVWLCLSSKSSCSNSFSTIFDSQERSSSYLQFSGEKGERETKTKRSISVRSSHEALYSFVGICCLHWDELSLGESAHEPNQQFFGSSWQCCRRLTLSLSTPLLTQSRLSRLQSLQPGRQLPDVLNGLAFPARTRQRLGAQRKAIEMNFGFCPQACFKFAAVCSR